MHFDQVILLIARHLIVKAGIAFGDRFQAVVEVKHNFVQRQIIDHHRAVARIGEVKLHPAAVLAEFQHIAQEIIRHKDRGLDPRLFDMIDIGQVGHIGGVVQFHHRPIPHMHMINHRRRGGDKVDIIFSFETVADDLKVQKTQEPAAEAEPKRG